MADHAHRASTFRRRLLLVATLLAACARPLPPPVVDRPPEEEPPPRVEPRAEKAPDEPAPDRKAPDEAAPDEAAPDDTGREPAPAETRRARPRPPVEPPGDGGTAPGEAPAPGPLAAPRLLRVGLATDLPSLSLPCCEGELVAEAGGQRLAVVSPLVIEPRSELERPGAYRLQVAALKDERQAQGLAAQLGEALSAPADAVFDAGTDLYRVRVGRYASREDAEAAQARLERLGVRESWVVSEAGRLGDAALELRQGTLSRRVPGRWLTIRPTSGEWVAYNGKRYRGRLLVFLNDRGTLNLINEVDVEDYLRGVVPREMGPGIFDHLEALKAQTVAARTYTLNNLAEFVREGYDICATPRCQVYDGVGVEHPLTDRAIAETVGEVLVYGGGLIDALYSSTCGGHTENVDVVFPRKKEPYLRGVPCLEAGVERLAGSSRGRVAFPAVLVRDLLPAAGPAGSPAALAARLEHLALLAGLPVPADRLASLDRREVQRFIASVFDLAVDARLFVAREDLPYLLDRRPAEWGEEELRLAAYLMRSGLLKGDLEEPLSPDQIEETLFQLALYLRVVEKLPVRHLRIADGALEVRAGEETRRFGLSPRMTTFRRRGGEMRAAPLSLLAGDRLTLYLHEGELLAAAQEVDLDGVSFDRTSSYSSWTRFRTDAELEELVNARYPGLGFRGFEILSRGVSGRVGRIRLLGREAGSVEVDGLAVRWTLDVPDTLFTARRLNPPGGTPGWLFTGRGWGHGVGLCQVGAYGMAVRGHTYREILRHYYSGVDLVRVRWRDTGTPAPRP